MKENFRKKVLKNGLTILFEKRELPVVSIAIAVKCGGMYESENEKGISHFIEHMLYKGTSKRTPKQISEEIEKNGGVMNGFTDENVTAFWCKMPSVHLDIGLDVLIDMMSNSLFDEKEMEKERKVIFEELKMRKDNPQIYSIDQNMGLIYEKPFGIPLIGNEKSMNSINRKKIIQRFKEFYHPKNMILCVVGNADFERVVRFAEKSFGRTDGKPKKFKIKQKQSSKTEKRKGISQTNIIFSYHTPLYSDKKSFAAEVLNTLMAQGMSSRLFMEIREKRNLAYAIQGYSQINKDFSYSMIYVGTTKENVGKVKKLVLEEFEKVAKNFTERGLNQIKEQLKGTHKISMEDSTNQMVGLIASEVNGKAEDYYDFGKNVDGVKLKDVIELSKKAAKKHSFFVLIPG
ncbi:insulinase family protein [Candidatus Pacearchaeota archaeon]|nr:insulinase family protein [Candidatus Pacearchaeota archaeon]